MIAAALLLSLAAAQAPGTPAAEERYDACLTLATEAPDQGEQAATDWRLAGGGFLARQCLGMAHANRERWSAAAEAFTAAAREAETARDVRAANYWAQAGNARLAEGRFADAAGALDAAIATGTMTGLALGEAHLDRARVRVASGDDLGARADLDRALVDARADPLAWLLSATLARRNADLPRARKDIAEAVRRAADDPAVQLEAGNIAGLSGDDAGARRAFAEAARLAPGTPVGRSAAAALDAMGPAAGVPASPVSPSVPTVTGR